MQDIDNGIDIFIGDRNFHDLNPVLLGWEQCAPGHAFGPFIREYYIIHYIVSGSGIFENQNGIHTLSAELKENYMVIELDGVKTTLRTEDLFPSFYLGITGCEGCCRFYDMKIEDQP